MQQICLKIGVLSLGFRAEALRSFGSAQTDRVNRIASTILSMESLNVLKEQAMQAQDATIREAVSGSIDEHLQSLKNSEYRKELQQGIMQTLQLANDMSSIMSNDWIEEQSSLLEDAGQMDLRAIMDVAEELQSRAGSLPRMNNILLETASESTARRADAVFTGMKKVLGQTSAIIREQTRTGQKPSVEWERPEEGLPKVLQVGGKGIIDTVVASASAVPRIPANPFFAPTAGFATAAKNIPLIVKDLAKEGIFDPPENPFTSRYQNGTKCPDEPQWFNDGGDEARIPPSVPKPLFPPIPGPLSVFSPLPAAAAGAAVFDPVYKLSRCWRDRTVPAGEEDCLPAYCKYFLRLVLPAAGWRYRNSKGWGIMVIPYNNWRHAAPPGVFKVDRVKKGGGTEKVDQFWTYAEVRLLTPYMAVNINPGVDSKVDPDKMSFVGMYVSIDLDKIRNPTQYGTGWNFYCHILSPGIGLWSPLYGRTEEIGVWWEVVDAYYSLAITNHIGRRDDNGCGGVKTSAWWYLYPWDLVKKANGAPGGLNFIHNLDYPDLDTEDGIKSWEKCKKFDGLQAGGLAMMFGAATVWGFANPLSSTTSTTKAPGS